MKLTKKETRRLVDDVRAGSGMAGSNSSGLTFRQFSTMLERCGRPDIANTTVGSGRRNFPSTAAASGEYPSPARAHRDNSSKRKEVTFRDENGGGSHHHNSVSRPLLRASLRRLTVSPASDSINPAGAGAAGAIGVGLRERLRRALHAAAEARGARRGNAHVDRETVRRAMVACAAPLDSQLLGDLERRLDRRGNGEINVEVTRRGGRGGAVDCERCYLLLPLNDGLTCQLHYR